MIIGEDLLKQVQDNRCIEIESKLITSNNIYGECCGHLIPISTNPLITPYSISIPHDTFNALISLVKKNIRSSISICSKGDILEMNYNSNLMLRINKRMINIYNKPKEIYKFNLYKTKNHSDYLTTIANIMIVFSSLINKIDLSILRYIINLLNNCLDSDIHHCLVNSIILHILGLGSGSTPSGDDFIIGFLISTRDILSEYTLNQILGIIEGANTTWLSKALIKEVINDPRYIISLYSLIVGYYLTIPIDVFISKTMDFIRVGGYSGMFMVHGLFAGLSYKERRLRQWIRIVKTI